MVPLLFNYLKFIATLEYYCAVVMCESQHSSSAY